MFCKHKFTVIRETVILPDPTLKNDYLASLGREYGVVPEWMITGGLNILLQCSECGKLKKHLLYGSKEISL